LTGLKAETTNRTARVNEVLPEARKMKSSSQFMEKYAPDRTPARFESIVRSHIGKHYAINAYSLSTVWTVHRRVARYYRAQKHAEVKISRRQRASALLETSPPRLQTWTRKPSTWKWQLCRALLPPMDAVSLSNSDVGKRCAVCSDQENADTFYDLK